MSGQDERKIDTSEPTPHGDEAPERSASSASDDAASATERPTDDPQPTVDRPATLRQRMVQLLLPPLLAAGAVGVHWWLNVPEHVQLSPRDQGAKGKAKKKTKKKARKKAKRKGRSAHLGKVGQFEPRGRDELERVWRRYEQTEFEREPELKAWARTHQTLINRAVVVARREAFDGAPEKPSVTLHKVDCRTVRCRFVLRSPYAHELDTLSQVLQGLQANGASLWHRYQIASEQPDQAEGQDKAQPTQQLPILVSFASDEIDSKQIVPREPEPDEGKEAEASQSAARPGTAAKPPA